MRAGRASFRPATPPPPWHTSTPSSTSMSSSPTCRCRASMASSSLAGCGSGARRCRPSRSRASTRSTWTGTRPASRRFSGSPSTSTRSAAPYETPSAPAELLGRVVLLRGPARGQLLLLTLFLGRRLVRDALLGALVGAERLVDRLAGAFGFLFVEVRVRGGRRHVAISCSGGSPRWSAPSGAPPAGSRFRRRLARAAVFQTGLERLHQAGHFRAAGRPGQRDVLAFGLGFDDLAQDVGVRIAELGRVPGAGQRVDQLAGEVHFLLRPALAGLGQVEILRGADLVGEAHG